MKKKNPSSFSCFFWLASEHRNPSIETMPYCETSLQDDGMLNRSMKLFYRTYGHGPTKVLLVIGLAGTHDCWGPQIKGLTGTDTPNDEIDADANAAAGVGGGGVEVCAFDNRGMGRSSVLIAKSEYTTTIMAKDSIALLDHLGWKKAHVFGHSMGAMIACKVAAMVPDRILSLALLNVTGGNIECFPALDRKTISIAIRFLRAKTPEQRAAVDLDTHYTTEYLEEYVGSNTRRSILYQEYVKGITASGMQTSFGFDGQVHACWKHKMTQSEIERMRSAGFLVSVIHGREDVIAQVRHARKLAEKLYPVARMVELHGGHLVSHERPEEVNQALIDLIMASQMKISPYDWTNLPTKNSGTGMSCGRTNAEQRSYIIKILEKLQLFILYLFGLFVLAFQYCRRLPQYLKPVRLGGALTQPSMR